MVLASVVTEEVGVEDSGAGARVLVVEDDASLGAGLVATLAGASYEVRWARDCAQARALLATAPADLVLLDFGLPDGDGLEVGRNLRALDDQSRRRRRPAGSLALRLRVTA